MANPFRIEAIPAFDRRSRVLYFFMKRGGKVSGRVYSTRYVRSPIPGGLEVPVEVTFTYEDDEKLCKIKSLIMENYDGFDKIKEVECDDSADEPDEPDNVALLVNICLYNIACKYLFI